MGDVRRASEGGDDVCRVVCGGHNAPPTGPPLVPPRPASHAALQTSDPSQFKPPPSAAASTHHAGVRSLQWQWGKVVSTGYSRKVLVHDAYNGTLLFSGTGH